MEQAPEAVVEELLREGVAGAGRWKGRTKMAPWTAPADRKRAFRTWRRTPVHHPADCHNFCKNRPFSPPGDLYHVGAAFGSIDRARTAEHGQARRVILLRDRATLPRVGPEPHRNRGPVAGALSVGSGVQAAQRVE